jgi:enamine deaminase RidA (YjgF/YER057c/UK114 family)
MDKKPINPQTWLNAFHMNHAIEVTNGQRVLYVAGQTSNDASGAAMHEGDYVAQFKLAWSNLVEILESAEMSPANIVRLNFYTTDTDAFMANAAELSETWAAADCMPVGTLLGVQSLFQPSTLIEIEATAVA